MSSTSFIPKRDHSRVSRYIIVVVSALLIGLISFSALDITADYRRTIASIEQQSRSYAGALHEHANRAFGEADRALVTVVESIAARGGLEALGDRQLYDLLQANARNAPQIGSIVLVNRSGTMFVNSLQFPMKPTNVSDRDYFIFHRDHPDRGIFISAPFKSRIVNKWRFSMSYALKDRNGRFDGLVAVAFEIDYFQRFYESLHPGADGRFILTRTDGTLLVVQPLMEGAFMSDFKRKSELITKYLPRAAAGTFHVSTPVLGTDSRIISYNSLSRYPVVADVSFSKERALKPWLTRARTVSLTMGTLCMLVATLTLLLIRQLKRLESTHAQLIAQQEVERKLTKAYKALSACNKSVAHAQSEAALLADVVRIVHEDCGYRMVWIGMARDDGEKSVRPVATAGFNDGFLHGIIVSWGDNPHGRGPSGTAIRTGAPVIIDSIQESPQFAPWRDDAVRRGYASTVSLPIRTGSQVLGALSVYADLPGAFSAEEIELLNEIAVNVGHGIETLQMRNDLDRAMAETHKLNEELEERVAERTSQLISANDALQLEIEQRTQAQEEVTWLNEDLLRQQHALVVANQELESFSYSVSHDLRAPLRHLCGFVNILQEDYAETLDATAKMYLNRISGASHKMGGLIDSLLELSRICQYKMHISRVDLTLLAREIAESLHEMATERQVELRIADGLTVQADETLMRNVLENLLGNAWKYTGRKETALIEFASFVEDGEEVYYVRDDGAGFDMNYSDKLFGAFQRLHGTEFDGMGIGLATVQRIIHRHEGRIWAEGAQDKGATFFFTVPMK